MKRRKNLLIAVILPFLMVSCRNLMDDDAYSSEYKRLEHKIIQTELLTSQNFDIYKDIGTGVQNSGNIILYFTKDGDIPYVEVSDFLKLCNEEYMDLYGSDYPFFKVSQNGSLYKVARDWNEKYYFTIDFSTGIVSYSDFDWFLLPKNAVASVDIITDDSVIHRLAVTDVRGNNVALTVNLNNYNIPIKFDSGYGFLPLSVLTLLSASAVMFIYNGEDVYLASDNPSQPFSSHISNPKSTWSKEFGEYSYNYFCLHMDMKYGRKDFLGVTKFNDWLTACGLKEDISSSSVLVSETALGKVLLTNIGDLHTYYNSLTPYIELDSSTGKLKREPDGIKNNESMIRQENNANVLKSKMSKKCLYYDTGTPGYRTDNTDRLDRIMNIYIPRHIDEKTNTIFLTFDNFISTINYPNYKSNWKYNTIGAKGINDGVYFFKLESGAEALVLDTSITTIAGFIDAVNTNTGNAYAINFARETDTILLTVVSNYIIRELNALNQSDSNEYPRKIENVVLDISRNGGGACDDNVFIASWFLGQSDFHTVNKITGSKCTVAYIADINFDEQYSNFFSYSNPASGLQKMDTICDLRRYCVTSLQSFSCGNIFPTQVAFKDNVTLIGHGSGGGTCVVENITMPSGTVFCTSSQWQFSTLNNGSYEDIESGARIDVNVDTENFDTIYDREVFCEKYIN